MKKSTKIWLIIAALCIVIGAVTFTVALSMEGFDFMELTTEKTEINNYKIGDAVDKIYIDTDTADIDFFTYRESEIRVECTETDKIKYDVCVEDSTLKIEVKDDRKWYDHIGFNFTRMLIKVYLPGGAEYSSVVINTTTGDVNLPEQIYTHTLDVKVTTGDISCSSPVTDTLKLQTTTGDVKVTGVNCNAIALKATTGDIKVAGVNCNAIALKATTGDITLEACDAKEIDIKVTTGDVKGTLLSGKTFNANTTTGDVDVPADSDGGICNIKTTTGDVKIEIIPSA